jgi:hypothetical protein
LNHILRQGLIAGQPERESHQIRAQGLANGLEAGAVQISAGIVLHV